MESKTDPKLWATITIAVAIISCLGVLGAALINILPDILKLTATPNNSTPIFVNTEIPQPTNSIQATEPVTTNTEIPQTQTTQSNSGFPATQVGPYWSWSDEFSSMTLMLNVLWVGDCANNIRPLAKVSLN